MKVFYMRKFEKNERVKFKEEHNVIISQLRFTPNKEYTILANFPAGGNLYAIIDDIGTLREVDEDYLTSVRYDRNFVIDGILE